MRFAWCAAPLCIGLIGITNHHEEIKTNLIHNYRSWRKATSQPQDMSAGMALSCIGPMKWDRGDNPHFPKVFVVYVNKAGEEAMFRKGSTSFPDGTVIVKEKYNRADILSKSRSYVQIAELRKNAKPVLLTVMTKKAGVWSYFAADADGRLLPGDTDSCVKCHEINRANDFAFRTYVPDSALPRNPWN